MGLTKRKVAAAVLVAALAVASGERAAAPGGEAVARADDAKAGEAAYSVKTMPPVVVRTEPQAGDTRVDAKAVTEIRATFSKNMQDGNWSWAQVSDETFPKVTGKIRYEKDRRTCVLPVKLEPHKTYVIWLNSSKFHNFEDAEGRPAVPYLLVFQTKADEPAKVCSVVGRVSYKGRPLPNGTIAFHPGQGKAVSAKIQEDGSYSAENVPVGELRVTVETTYKGVPNKKFVRIPDKYKAPQTSGLTYDAKEGKQAFDIDLR